MEKVGFLAHIRFFDFRSHLGLANPAWVSIVRDPVERFISRYINQPVLIQCMYVYWLPSVNVSMEKDSINWA